MYQGLYPQLCYCRVSPFVPNILLQYGRGVCKIGPLQVQHAFSCITTGFTTKTNQSVYDLCGSNPVSEDIYYFATLGYKHLQNAVNTKQYTYPAPISLLDIEQVISGIELTYSSYVSNQKYSEYHYTDEERKSLLEKNLAL